MSTDSVRAVVRVRTLGPAGLNPPQIEVINRLQMLADEGPVDELDVDVWGPSMGTTQDRRNPTETRERVAEFEHWATEQGYTLRPAFQWQSSESAGDTGSQKQEIVTPLITLAIYTENEGALQVVYPHVDGEDVCTIHDGVEALESMADNTDRSGDEQRKQEGVPAE
ncbi:HTH domain-containing protein [Halalkalicoccus sp. NIPERK01]|uniref:HTH domain-containing protein n=1 Tax=Halalkalicoccus sp. NIPERK01 TaxID=3053469 RepID=UPI00256EBADE|nr:HTH domain-containing protein [Halalkalicoccus sp. NIPERK01]MDL5363096.1 hypothetical protein [Halalkalicoccus sp. NIPERK01]